MSKILVSNQFDPYLNIAVENYLLAQPSDGDITLYLWRNRRTVVIGQYQNPYAECNVDLLEADGGLLMRRRTGGGAVFHDLGNLNFSFIVPYGLYNLSRQLSVLQKAVAYFGLATEVSGRNDVLCDGRKFSGNAFAKGKHQRLHHGTILIHTDVEAIQKYLKVKPAKLHKHGVDSHQSRVVNLAELNPSITAQGMIPWLMAAYSEQYGSPIDALSFEHIAAQPEVQQLRDSFASPEWKYGRWQQFQAQRSAQFDWGGVELNLQVDESSATITDIAIASDCLFPEAIGLAQQLLQGASSLQPPAIPVSADATSAAIIRDIFGLLF